MKTKTLKEIATLIAGFALCIYQPSMMIAISLAMNSDNTFAVSLFTTGIAVSCAMWGIAGIVYVIYQKREYDEKYT